jgi:hypothetical protein
MQYKLFMSANEKYLDRYSTIDSQESAAIKKILAKKNWINELTGVVIITDANERNKWQQKIFRKPGFDEHRADSKNPKKTLVMIMLKEGDKDKLHGPIYVDSSNVEGLFDKKPYDSKKLMSTISAIASDGFKMRADFYIDTIEDLMKNIDRGLDPKTRGDVSEAELEKNFDKFDGLLKEEAPNVPKSGEALKLWSFIRNLVKPEQQPTASPEAKSERKC